MENCVTIVKATAEYGEKLLLGTALGLLRYDSWYHMGHVPVLSTDIKGKQIIAGGWRESS